MLAVLMCESVYSNSPYTEHYTMGEDSSSQIKTIHLNHRQQNLTAFMSKKIIWNHIYYRPVSEFNMLPSPVSLL